MTTDSEIMRNWDAICKTLNLCKEGSEREAAIRLWRMAEKKGAEEEYKKWKESEHAYLKKNGMLKLLAEARADVRRDSERYIKAAFENGIKKGQADLHNKLIARISGWGIELNPNEGKEISTLRRVMEMIDEEASESAGDKK
jgi:hypothetical protein